MGRCTELCTKDTTGVCALCEALAECDPIPDLPGDSQCTLGLQSLEILPERFIDGLGIGEAVEVDLSCGEVYLPSDLARRANERALRKNAFLYFRLVTILSRG